MIRNVILKKMIKNVVFPIITLLNKIVKKDDSIVLLYISNMGIRHSLLPLRQYLLDNHFNERYKIYCGIEHLKYAEDEPRVTFISGGKTLLVFLRAKHVFYTAGQLPVKPASSQIVIHMDHGNANFKTMYNPQIQISAESETKRSIFREKDKTKRSKKESAQHSKSRNKSFVMTSVSAL